LFFQTGERSTVIYSLPLKNGKLKVAERRALLKKLYKSPYEVKKATGRSPLSEESYHNIQNFKLDSASLVKDWTFGLTQHENLPMVP
jgi:hypothetical protein